MRKLPFFVACLLMLGISVMHWQRALPAPQAHEPPTPVMHAFTEVNVSAPDITPSVTGEPTRVALDAESLRAQLNNTSLQGTEPPAAPTIDAEGNLVIDSSLRSIFDYFLTLDGERDNATLEQWIYSYLAQHLPAHEASRAMDVFTRYQQLLTQPDSDIESFGNAVDLDQRLQALWEKRRAALGNEIADAFFGEEEAYDRYTLEKIEAHRTDSDNLDGLNPWSINASEALTPEMQERQQIQQEQEAVMQATTQLENSGASAAEIYQYHLLHGNTEYAERYLKLSESRQQWQQRFDAYKIQRDQLATDIADPQLREQRLQQWMASQFSDYEILRIHSMERMEAGG